MTDAEWNRHWQALHDRLKCQEPVTLRDRRKPTDSHLDRLEAAIDLPLPRSYRAFVRVFGAVDLAKRYTIFAPGYRTPRGHRGDFLFWNRQLRSADTGETDPRLARAVYFAHETVGLGFFFWDRAEASSPDGPEYRIFYRPHVPEDPVASVTETFQDFIERSCLKGAFLRMMGWTKATRAAQWFAPIGGDPTSPV